MAEAAQLDRRAIDTFGELARRSGFAGYIDDGSSRWPAVHRLDAAKLLRLALESAPAGSVLHAVAEPGIPTREIAEAIGRSIDVPAQSVPTASADERFGWIDRFFGMDTTVSNDLTRTLLGWTPTHPGLIPDLDAGSYADAVPNATAGG